MIQACRKLILIAKQTVVLNDNEFLNIEKVLFYTIKRSFLMTTSFYSIKKWLMKPINSVNKKRYFKYNITNKCYIFG